MNAQLLICNVPEAANDPTFPPEPPAGPCGAAAIDPAVQAWALDFDAWLETPEGEQWVASMEETAYPLDAHEQTDAYA